jgi:hypothetical protein
VEWAGVGDAAVEVAAGRVERDGDGGAAGLVLSASGGCTAAVLAEAC